MALQGIPQGDHWSRLGAPEVELLVFLYQHQPQAVGRLSNEQYQRTMALHAQGYVQITLGGGGRWAGLTGKGREAVSHRSQGTLDRRGETRS